MPEARILLVEDETIVAMDIAATLRRVGYTVVGVVASGPAAIEAAATNTPDVVLMDIRLRGAMDGTEAAVAIREQTDVPIVFLTAHADQNTVDRSEKAAPYGFVLKPFDDRDLPRAIELALRRHRDEKMLRAKDLEALWASEERFRLLVDAVRDYAIAIVDLDGRVVTWNTGAERMTGYPAAEIVGKPITTFYPDDGCGQEPFPRELAAMSETESVDMESWWVRKNGTRFLAHAVRSAITDSIGRTVGCATVVQDVTERRTVEAQILQSQKLESLGKLAGGIAHDFNNMLMVILSRAEVLLRQTGGSQPQTRYLEDIKSAAVKSGALTQQLLAASRRQVLQPQIVDINEMVQSTMRLLSSSIGEDIVIRTELEPELWPVYADPGKLHQVLMNLALNSRDAMPEGGTLTVETRNVGVTASDVRQHPELRAGEHVALFVSDSGHGMPRELQQQIYDPFFTTKETGTGLGLAVVKGIVEQSGGRIRLYSEPGEGTTFTIYFPRHGQHETAVVTDLVDHAEENVPKMILVVEDDDLVRSIIQETLSDSGYRVLAAASPKEALAISRTHPGPIDVLLTDVVMLGMNGRLLADQLSKERPAMKVVFMSGYTDDGMVHQGVLEPGVMFLEKPASPDALRNIIQKALKSRG